MFILLLLLLLSWAFAQTLTTTSTTLNGEALTCVDLLDGNGFSDSDWFTNPIDFKTTEPPVATLPKGNSILFATSGVSGGQYKAEIDVHLPKGLQSLNVSLGVMTNSAKAFRVKLEFFEAASWSIPTGTLQAADDSYAIVNWSPKGLDGSSMHQFFLSVQSRSKDEYWIAITDLQIIACYTTDYPFIPDWLFGLLIGISGSSLLVMFGYILYRRKRPLQKYKNLQMEILDKA